MVLPVHKVQSQYVLLGSLCSVNHTRLHSQEAGPRIVRAAIAQASQETEEQANKVGMAWVQLLHPSSTDC